MPFFSLIVPVYNTAPFLDRCLESIVSQDFQDWELILIDDGSTDGSSDLCDRWAAKDERICCYHQQNRGVSAARNRALLHARGTWIWFIDSDDYILPRSLVTLAETSAHQKAELIVFNENITGSFQGELDAFLPKYYFPYIVGFGPCNKIYLRALIEENTIRFDVEERIGEDLLFNLSYYKCCTRYFFLGKNLYYYDKREGSAMTTSSKTRHVNQMRLFTKIFKILNHTVSDLHMSVFYFLHLIGGINQSREAGLTFWEARRLIRQYRQLFPFSRSMYRKGLQYFLHSEGASLLGKARMYLMLFPY